MLAPSVPYVAAWNLSFLMVSFSAPNVGRSLKYVLFYNSPELVPLARPLHHIKGLARETIQLALMVLQYASCRPRSNCLL